MYEFDWMTNEEAAAARCEVVACRGAEVRAVKRTGVVAAFLTKRMFQRKGWRASIVLLAALAGLAGCAEKRTSWGVVVDSHFGAEDRAAIAAAAADWEAKTGARLEVAVRDECPGTPGTICVWLTDEAGLRTVPGDIPDRIAATLRTGDDGANVWLAPDLMPRDPAHVQEVAAHELGHAMGLEHLGAGTVMAPSLGEASTVVTAADVDAWEAAN